IAITQALAGLPRDNAIPESHLFDVLAGVTVVDPSTPTAILGGLWSPVKNLRVAASFRPSVSVFASGPLDIEPHESLKSQVVIDGAQTTTLALSLPANARLGAAYDHALFTASLDLVYEGWSATEAFVLTPDLEVGVAGAPPEKLDAF